MANNEKHKVTGLWSRMAPFGEVLSAKVRKSEIVEALAKCPGDDVEVSVLPAKERKGETSPTHVLKVGEPYRKDDSRRPTGGDDVSF